MTKKNRKTGVPSGFTDMLPAEKSRFNGLIKTLSPVVESYDFTPIDTPTVEWMDTLRGQDDSGGKLIYGVRNGYDEDAEIDKGLRFDLTLPLARYCGDHTHELPLPFRRYHIGNVFRGETAQTGRGRYREFTQFDADIVGATGVIADGEIAAMLVDGMRALSLPATVKINNRRILDGLIEVGGITDPEIAGAVFRTIDKFDKIGKDSVIAEISELTSSDFADLVGKYLAISGSYQEKMDGLTNLIGSSAATREGLANISEVFALLTESGYADSISFSPEIVRGLGYYTGIIYETFITGYEQFGSVASGGRYDNLIEDLGGPSFPAVGASFGINRLLDVLAVHNGNMGSQTPAQVCIINFSDKLAAAYFSLATQLRQASIPTHLYHEHKKIGPQLKYAGDLAIPFAVLIGEEEAAKGTAIIRNLKTREQTEVKNTDLIPELQAKIAQQ